MLALRIDGREAARTRDAKPLPLSAKGSRGTPAVFAYARPDSVGPADLSWDDFVVKSATVEGAVR